LRALIESKRLTEQRDADLEFNKTKKGYTFVHHAVGRVLCEALLDDLTRYMATPRARPTNKGLWAVVRQLTPRHRAFIALSALTHYLVTDHDEDEESPGMKCRLQIGHVLYADLVTRKLLKVDRGKFRRLMQADDKHQEIWKYRQSEWSDPQCVVAGDWLVDAVCDCFPDYFFLGDQSGVDLPGIPYVTSVGEKYALALAEGFVYGHPIFVPVTGEIKDWTRWRCGGYWDDGTGISASFVRGARPEVEEAFKRIFRRKTTIPHIRGVNVLQRVPYTINTLVLPVVKRFAGKVGKRVNKYRRQRDIAIAEWLGDDRFRVPLSCDFRGRIYGVSDFHFAREDHVRSLFRFAEGLPIGDDGLRQLMIHAANCGDFEKVSKASFDDRVRWVEDHRDQITRVAQYPQARANKAWWREADAPFSFVAACQELTAAWKAGPHFITHLPICLDATASGLQHLSMMLRDADAGRYVNLIPCDVPYDMYEHLAKAVIARLEADDDERAKADWWIRRLRRSDARKLVKRPMMTYGYNVSLTGMKRQLDEVESNGDTFYLAQRIMETTKAELPGPTAVMEFIEDLAEEAYNQGKPLACTMPSGFAWSNIYRKSNTKVVYLPYRDEHARYSKYRRYHVGDGFTPEMRKLKTLNAAAPNFVHGCDAALLISAANALAEAGITNIATIHDCVAFRAPEVAKGRDIVLDQLAKLYINHDPLAELRDAIQSTRPLPAKGSLNINGVRRAIYAFS